MTALARPAEPLSTRPLIPPAGQIPARMPAAVSVHGTPVQTLSRNVRASLAPSLPAALHLEKPVERGWNPALALSEAAPFGYRLVRPGELTPAHTASEEIMGMRLAPVSAIAAAHAQTGGAGWVHLSDPHQTRTPTASEISGIILLLPLSPDGERDLREGRFQPRAPQSHQLCAPGDPFPAIYFWLFAGRDGRARRNIIRTCLAWRNGIYANVRGYARGASVEGCRTMAALGFEPMSSALSHLFFIDKRS